MVISKETLLGRLVKLYVYLLLAVYPLGQLLRQNVAFNNHFAVIQGIDILAGVAAPLFLLISKKVSNFQPFLFLAATFFLTFLVSDYSSLTGLLYLTRLTAYMCLWLLFSYLVTANFVKKGFFINAMIATGLVACFFGWLQYFFVPDLTWLKYFGWDDHLYRLTGTFLDPGFMGIIAVFGVLTSFHLFTTTKKPTLLIATFIYLLTLLFTYSRASFLAMAIGLVVVTIGYSKKGVALVLLATLTIGIVLLPRPYGEGVNLNRTQSIYLRLGNFGETWAIFQANPLFGIGYNNLCDYKVANKLSNSRSHACSGADNSILFTLATTGVVGLLILISTYLLVLKQIQNGNRKGLFVIATCVLVIHSLFTNSLFYPWVLVWLGALYAEAQSKD